MILANTYHLYLRPGHEVIARFDGLHKFMHWDGHILTASGGFQVFSLAKLREITDAGVTFHSHLDGSKHLLTPEKGVEIQEALGADIMMCLDECTPYPASREYARSSLELTTDWASRCKEAKRSERSTLFGIVQGGMYADLRLESAERLIEIGFPGYAIGGLSVGEPHDLMNDIVYHTLPVLPKERPRYVMGVGRPKNLIDLVAMGADMFDCVLPTRNARNGQLFTRCGTVNIKKACYISDQEPIEAGCSCYTCQHYSKSYLRHLYMAREILAYRLNTIHNIHFFMQLMKDIRNAVRDGTMHRLQKDYCDIRKADA
jgi:queuine tRNA-ribosyltransferase